MSNNEWLADLKPLPSLQYRHGQRSVQLLCPRCGDMYLHQHDVEVFNRGEDAREGLHVLIDGETLRQDRSMEGNPSWRRHGLRILFSCEQCDSVASENESTPPRWWLNISQHKGNTYIEWDTSVA